MTHTIPPFESAEDVGYKFLRVFADYSMERSDTITLYVEGGVSPYDWSMDDEYSEHLTLGSAQTEGQSNTIESSADAPDDMEAIITVVDAEGSEVTIIVGICDSPCCDSPPAFSFDDDSTDDELTGDDCIDLYTDGGCFPITWEITSGSDASITDDLTYYGQAELCADICCGPGQQDIKATDRCGQEVEFTIGSEDPTLSFDWDNTPETIDEGGYIDIYILGGCPPFTWSTSSTGYTLDYAETEDRHNILRATSGDCDVEFDPSCIVVVVDDCGTSIGDENTAIRNTEGHWGAWVKKIDYTYNDLCDEKSCNSAGPAGWHYMMLNDTDGVYGSVRFRYTWTPGTFPTCKASDPDDCCGDWQAGAWNCGYSQNPARGALCGYFIAYGPAITIPIYPGEERGCCQFELWQSDWECP